MIYLLKCEKWLDESLKIMPRHDIFLMVSQVMPSALVYMWLTYNSFVRIERNMKQFRDANWRQKSCPRGKEV